MTAVRPGNRSGAGGQQPPYGDSGPFAAAVGRPGDPLGDPLPGRPRAGGSPSDGSPWFADEPPAAPAPRSRRRPPHPVPPQDPASPGGPQVPPARHARHAAPGDDPGGREPDPGAYGAPGGHGDPAAFGGPGPYGPAGPYDPHGAPFTGPADPGPVHGRPGAPQTAAEPPAAAPGPGPAPEPYGAAHEPHAARPPAPGRRRGGLEATAQMPVVTDDPADDPAATPDAAADPPAPGGRAERRKAAKRGTGRRRTPAPAPALPAGAADGPDPAGGRPPVSRMEAKRAARAAKSSPGVLVSQAAGELFITFGVLMLLFVVYQLWYTNILAGEATSSATKNLQHEWASHETSSDAGEPSSFTDGTDFAIIYIPKLDVKAPIAEGIEKDDILDKGMVGHYSGDQETAMPWKKSGNFALAGHRNTHGEPFRYINKLVPGDKVVVETSGMYYTYAVSSMLPQTSPANVSVIEPVPDGSGFTGPGRYITLTTCTPEFTSTYRMIVWGTMVAEQPRSKGLPAALLGG